MLIESAFYKLSDYFQSVESPGELYESQLSFIFAVAIFQEFQARGFSTCYPTFRSTDLIQENSNVRLIFL